MNSKNNQQQFLTISDVQEHLNISQSAAYELTHRKDFPVCRVGGSVRIPREAFLAWVDMKTQITAQLRAYMAAAM